MVNDEFQELKRLWSINVGERISIMEQMRKNLIDRNSGLSDYKFEYTSNKMVDINSIDNPEDLFAIDGDMCPRGL